MYGYKLFGRYNVQNLHPHPAYFIPKVKIKFLWWERWVTKFYEKIKKIKASTPTFY